MALVLGQHCKGKLEGFSLEAGSLGMIILALLSD